MVNATPVSPRYMGIGIRIDNELSVDAVGNMRRLGGLVFVHVMVVPCDGLAGRIQSCPESADAGLTIEIVAHVFLARPDQLDRVMYLGRDSRSLNRDIGERAPAEAAAEVLVIYGHIRRAKSDCFAGAFRKFERILCSQPELAFTVVHPRRTVHRFHRRVRQVRDAILGCNNLIGSRQRTFGITAAEVGMLFVLGSGFVEVGGELPEDVTLFAVSIAAIVEFDSELLECLARLPVTVRYDGDCVAQIDDLANPRHILNRSIVNRRDPATEHGCCANSCVLHAR